MSEKGFGTDDDPRSFPRVLPVADVLPPAAPPDWLIEARDHINRWQRSQERGRRIAVALAPFYVVAGLVLLYEVMGLPRPDEYFAVGAFGVVAGYQWLLPYVTARWNRPSSLSIRQPEPPEAGNVG